MELKLRIELQDFFSTNCPISIAIVSDYTMEWEIKIDEESGNKKMD